MELVGLNQERVSKIEVERIFMEGLIIFRGTVPSSATNKHRGSKYIKAVREIHLFIRFTPNPVGGNLSFPHTKTLIETYNKGMRRMY